MSNLPIKEEKGFFKKIKLFFRKLFYKQEQIEHPKVSNELKINEINTSKETFETSIKVQVNDEHVKETQKDEFIKQIEKNPDLLYSLPLEKIQKLRQYYHTLVKKEELENERLKEELKKLTNAS